MEYDHMIEAFATNGANHPLDVGSLPRRARCRQDFANAQVSHVFSEVIAKDRIAAAQHIFADTALSDVDAQFEQFAVDARCTPTGILPAHLANQISDFT